MWQRYHRDLVEAWAHIHAVRSQLLDTPDGRVEYVTSGAGRPLLMSHGILGGHVEGLGMVATYVGQHVHAIAPSRFGYFRSDLPRDATPALQADAYAILLDHLGIDEAVIVGYSAGGTIRDRVRPAIPRTDQRARPCLLRPSSARGRSLDAE